MTLYFHILWLWIKLAKWNYLDKSTFFTDTTWVGDSLKSLWYHMNKVNLDNNWAVIHDSIGVTSLENIALQTLGSGE